MTSFSHVDCFGVPLDAKLDGLFGGKTGGFFVELGAFDGLAQSNTAFFEFERGWCGVLVEPSKVVFDSCVKNRPKSRCFNVACVSDSQVRPFVFGDFTGNLMSSIEGKRLAKGQGALVSVRTETLSALLDQSEVPQSGIDLLSLDVEGAELDVLKGLDLKRHRPRVLLVEVYPAEAEELTSLLRTHGYEFHSNFTGYSKATNPCWDGTHNDFLFVLQGR